ncbi:hypothetical protein JIN84_06005 [Luteolibacter yonseiensis]|uniref:Uncharacterized protein n=1 Tax=Luteolibacter yonseiensis TaxID=1144680 RepID=A0A934R1E4_9BACT|nr:hypothetical protein [Luteolibacter yonseiensis]MBK1815156.1 hypothetical protein [Luteolibacter yonseiensis]
MSVSVLPPSIVTYDGNNSTITPYIVGFAFAKKEHLVVTVTSAKGVVTVLAPTTGYTVGGEGNPGGGTVKTTEAWDSSHKVAITRSVPLEQPFVYAEGQRIRMKTLEASLDWIVPQVQGVWNRLGTYAAALATHALNTTNPHAVTKAQVGLGNVDNTSDADKPINDATLVALAGVARTDIPNTWDEPNSFGTLTVREGSGTSLGGAVNIAFSEDSGTMLHLHSSSQEPGEDLFAIVYSNEFEGLFFVKKDGACSALSFTGNGAGLTNLSAAALGGTKAEFDAAASDGNFVWQGSPASVTNLTVTGNTVLGDATTDTITVSGRFASSLIPNGNNTLDLGASSFCYKDGWFAGSVVVPQMHGGTVANGSIHLQGTSNGTRTTSYLTLQRNGGFVGVGTAVPTTLVEVSGSTPEVTLTNTASSNKQWKCSLQGSGFKITETGQGDRLVISAGGAVSIGSGALSAGSITTTGTIAAGGQTELSATQAAATGASAISRDLLRGAYAELASDQTTAANTTLSDITGLGLTLPAGIYQLSGITMASPANSAMGIKVNISIVGTGTLFGFNTYHNSTSIQTTPYSLTSIAAFGDMRQTNGGVNGQPGVSEHHCILKVTSGSAVVKMQFAQHTSDAAPLTAKAGSHLRAVRIG